MRSTVIESDKKSSVNIEKLKTATERLKEQNDRLEAMLKTKK